MSSIDNFGQITQDFTPRIHLSDEDFSVLTHCGKLLDNEGMLRIEAFEEVMREQVTIISINCKQPC